MCNLSWSFVLKREHICLYLDKYTNRSAVERLGNPIVSLAMWVFSSDKVVLTKHELKHQTFIPVVVSNASTIGLDFEVPALPMKFDIKIKFQDFKSGCPLSTVGPTNIYIDNLAAKMLRDDIHTDIEIKTASSDDLRIAAHAGVLVAMSPVFMEVLPNPLPECKPYIYTISNLDISFEASRAFINYFYRNMETEEFLSKREELAQLAEHYQVTDLPDRYDESLQRDVRIENAYRMLVLAHNQTLLKLKTTCTRLLMEFGAVLPEIINDLSTAADKNVPYLHLYQHFEKCSA